MAQDLAHLMFATRTLIEHNAELSQMVLEAEKIMNDTLVKSFEKDIEIHELTNKLNQKGPDVQLP